MNLLELCKNLTEQNGRLLPADHPLGARIVCPEYSPSSVEVKTYPLIDEQRIFALCWNISHKNRLNATMCPAPERFHYSRVFEANCLTQLHTHDYLELSYIIEGEFTQIILGKEITFSQGDLCLIDKNCIHQDSITTSDAMILFLGIANDMFKEVMNENITTENIIAFLQSALMKQTSIQQYLHFKPRKVPGAAASSSSALDTCLSLLLAELHHPNVGGSYICKGLLLRIFRILSTEYTFSLSKENQKAMNWLVFEEVSNYIKAHFQSVSIQDLVTIFHYQEDYFNRLIKQKTGLTYSGYVQQIRLEKAEALLTTTSMSIDAIAEASGYHNKGFFYKIFQAKYGTTPANYRKTSS